MSARERLRALADASPASWVRGHEIAALDLALAAYRMAIEDAARACIDSMRDSGDEIPHERCAAAVRSLAEGL